MRGRAHLTNIASGLCGAFGSRNNDLEGYWSIGKLRLLVEQYGQTTVSIDLLNSSMRPSSSGFAFLLTRYRLLLVKLADRTGIRFHEITAAHLTVAFVPAPWPRTSDYPLQWGDQFVLTVTIQADGRTAGVRRHAGYCRPHDPARERRSIRRSG